MLETTNRLIQKSLDSTSMDTKHYLNSSTRCKILASFGETAKPHDWKKRLEYIEFGKFNLTLGDCVRSWLAILTTREVVPIWKEVLSKTNHIKFGFNLVDNNVSLSKHEGDSYSCNTAFPEYLLELAEKTLKDKRNLEVAIEESSTAHTIIGNFMGFEQENYPVEAHHVNLSAYHALLETIGFQTYDFRASNNSNEYIFSAYKAAPASAAYMVYAGIYEKNSWVGEFDSQASLEFWVWWLTEAIPQAWELGNSNFNRKLL